MNALVEQLYFLAPTPLQNLLVSFYGKRLWKRRYGAGFAERLAEIEALDAMAPGELDAEIGRRIRRTAMYCGAEVPYYRELFAERGIDPRGIDSIEALAAIPILEKETLRERPEAFRVADAEGRTHATQVTSGSTGTPLSLAVDRETYQIAMALLVHYEQLHGVGLGDPRATFAGRMVQRATDMRPPFWRFNRAENQMIFSAYHLNAQTVGDYVRGLDAFRPAELIGYPSAIAALASLMRDAGLSLAFRPKLVVTNSETLFGWQREVIGEVLAAPVHDYYGTAEYLVFGWDMHGLGYRLHPSLGVAETVDGDDRPIREAPGDLLCTTLSNRVQPLLRFRIGDVATLADPATHPEVGGQVLRGIEGRVDDVVITPDGRRIGRLDHVFKGVSGIRECQVIQHEPARFELLLVPAEGYDESIPALVKSNLEHRMGCPCEVTTTLVEQVPRGANGKFKGVVSRVAS